MKGLSHTVIGDLAKIGEGRFGGDGAEVWVGVEGLEELGGAHGLSEGVDAAGMILRVQKIDPLVDVVAFKQTVSASGPPLIPWARASGRRTVNP